MMAMNSFFSRWSEGAGFDLPRLQEGEEAHVLAVDDSLVDRKVIERLLKIYSCKVTAVDSGRRALQFLGLDEELENHGSAVEGLKVDLIITDYCMPGMTGYELLKKIKESAAFREIPVVIMSSENVHTRIDRCLEEGAEDFIVKPVKLSDLERLKEHLTARVKALKRRRGALSSNKRKQPDAPDLSASSESESSPSSQSMASTPSPSPPPSSRSSPSPLSSSLPDSLNLTSEPSDSTRPTTPDKPSQSASRGVKSPRSPDGAVDDSLLL